MRLKNDNIDINRGETFTLDIGFVNEEGVPLMIGSGIHNPQIVVRVNNSMFKDDLVLEKSFFLYDGSNIIKAPYNTEVDGDVELRYISETQTYELWYKSTTGNMNTGILIDSFIDTFDELKPEEISFAKEADLTLMNAFKKADIKGIYKQPTSSLEDGFYVELGGYVGTYPVHKIEGGVEVEPNTYEFKSQLYRVTFDNGQVKYYVIDFNKATGWREYEFRITVPFTYDETVDLKNNSYVYEVVLYGGNVNYDENGLTLKPDYKTFLIKPKLLRIGGSINE